MFGRISRLREELAAKEVLLKTRTSALDGANAALSAMSEQPDIEVQMHALAHLSDGDKVRVEFSTGDLWQVSVTVKRKRHVASGKYLHLALAELLERLG